MSQPKWKFIAQLGDVDFINHGGKFLFVDETGVYPPVLEILDLVEGDQEPVYNEESEEHEILEEGNMRWEIYRISLEPCTFINNILSDNKYHPEHPAWFADSLNSVSDSMDTNPQELIQRLCSDITEERAWAYIDLAEHHGLVNFDSYPLRFSDVEDSKNDGDREDLERRYANCK